MVPGLEPEIKGYDFAVDPDASLLHQPTGLPPGGSETDAPQQLADTNAFC